MLRPITCRDVKTIAAGNYSVISEFAYANQNTLNVNSIDEPVFSLLKYIFKVQFRLSF
jgi:hypothetical protein